MGRILYIDPWAGASGDMFLAALIDAGVHLRSSGGVSARWAEELSDPESVLSDTVAALGLQGVEARVTSGREGGFACRRVDVVDTTVPVARSLADLEGILDRSRLPASAVAAARTALRRLTEVEAGLHGVGVDQVHLHELGAVDTLVDVVGTMVLVDALGIECAVHGPLPVGAGQVTTAHGRLGVPPPATLALLRGRPVYGGSETSEVTTPTGALLVTELATSWGPLPAMEVEAVGYGAGSRTLEHGPNLLRLVIGRPVAVGAATDDQVPGESAETGGAEADRVVELRATLDDASPEILGHLQGRLLSGGALETWWTPVYMKKGRPGAELTVLCAPTDEARVVDLVFRESTSFGVRRTLVARHRLERSWVEVEVDGLLVRVKVGRRRGSVVSVSPEYEAAAAAAARLDRPLKDVMRDAAAAAARAVGSPDP